MIIDNLFRNVADNGHVCVGLDTDYHYLPSQFANQFLKISDAIFEFNKQIIDATNDVTACYKIQIAYYEAYGIEECGLSKNACLPQINRSIFNRRCKKGILLKQLRCMQKLTFSGF
jgi:orotidine-5'-phosphate decarboxylase